MSRLPGDVDVVIVGYGPVGAAIAALLGRYGVRTLVVDRAPGIYMAPRAIAMDNEALRILQMIGVADDAFPKVVIPHVRMLCPHLGEFARADTSGTIDGHPKLVNFYQPGLERALRAIVEGQETVTARDGVEMVRFTDRGDGVRVVLRSSDGVESVVNSSYLVGADGAHSNVRHAIGEGFAGRTYTEDWLVIDASGVPENIDHVEFLCDPDRPGPHMVAPDGRTRWEFMLKPDETREEMERDSTIARLLEPWAPAGTIRIERKAVYRFHERVCCRFRKGRVFLAGDAAHLTPPFVGQGLVAGLRDAANLAWKLAWVVHGRASETILDTYDEERRPHAAKMIALAKFMGQMVMPRDHVRAVVLHGAMALLRRTRSGRALIDELEIKPKNVYGTGLFVRGGRRGAWFPQVRRSDDVLGSGLALVGHGIALSERNRRRWANAGGRTVSLPDATKRGWCTVVRPDRTVMHEGPVQDADRLVRESLRLLGAPAV